VLASAPAWLSVRDWGLINPDYGTTWY